MSSIFALFLLWSGSLSAQELFPGGSETKAAGVASSLACAGASCLSYNPGNLSAVGVAPYLEVGYAEVRQSYEHPNFDPVKVQVNTPIASLGVLHRLTRLPLTYGFYLLPLSYGKQKINGLPRRIAGSFESLDVRNESNMYDLVLGAAYELNEVATIGVSVVRRSEQRKIFATRVGDETPLIRYDGHNVFYLPMLGTNITPYPWLKIGLSYRAARRKSYKGRQKAATDDKITTPRNINYDPAIVYNSVDIKPYDKLTVRLTNNRYLFARGSGKVREGLTTQVQKADLKDIDERSVALIYRARPSLDLSLAYGSSPSPWGAGHYSDVAEDYVIGTDFGAVNNVSRRVYAVGARYELSPKFILSASYFDSYGSREIGPKGDKPGFYKSSSQVLSISLSNSF